MLGLPIIIKSDFLCKLIAWSSVLGVLTLGSAQPGKSTFDGAVSKDYTTLINTSASPVSNCNIWVPLCQTGSIAVDINVATATLKPTMLCSDYVSAQSAFMEHVVLDPSGWSTYDLYISLWRRAEKPSSFGPRVLSPVSALLQTTTSASLKSASDRDPSAAPADFGSLSLPVVTNGPLVKPPRKSNGEILEVLVPVATLLPTTASASLESASDRDLTLSTSAAPADSGSPSLPVKSNEPHVKTSKLGPTASSRQTSSTSGHDSATGHIAPSPVHSEHRSSRKPSTNLGYSSQPPLNEPGQEPSNFFPVNRGQQKQDSPKGSGEEPAQVSPEGPSDEREQVTSESQEHQQQTNQRKQEHQGSAVSNLGRASQLVLSINHVVSHFPETIPGTVLSSLSSKALVIADATIRPCKSTSSHPSSFFAASNITTAAAGSAPFDTSTLNSARKAEASTLSCTPGSLRYMRVVHTITKRDVDLPTVNTSNGTTTTTTNTTSISISRSNTMTALRGLQSKTHVPRKLMIFGGCIIFSLACMSF